MGREMPDLLRWWPTLPADKSATMASSASGACSRTELASLLDLKDKESHKLCLMSMAPERCVLVGQLCSLHVQTCFWTWQGHPNGLVVLGKGRERSHRQPPRVDAPP